MSRENYVDLFERVRLIYSDAYTGFSMGQVLSKVAGSIIHTAVERGTIRNVRDCLKVIVEILDLMQLERREAVRRIANALGEGGG